MSFPFAATTPTTSREYRKHRAERMRDSFSNPWRSIVRGFLRTLMVQYPRFRPNQLCEIIFECNALISISYIEIYQFMSVRPHVWL